MTWFCISTLNNECKKENTCGRCFWTENNTFSFCKKIMSWFFFSLTPNSGQFPPCNHQIRSSRPGVFCKKAFLRNFTKFTGKHLCQSLLFNKVSCLRPATLLKKRLQHRCFPVNFAKFLRPPFFTEHLRWLLLPDHLRFCDFLQEYQNGTMICYGLI